MMADREKIAEKNVSAIDIGQNPAGSAEEVSLISSTGTDAASPLFTRGKIISHHPHAGVNPLVDAAAVLFSMTGRLKQIRSWRHLNALHKELVAEVNTFQEISKSHGYSAEYILVSRYALCATLDDVISNTAWGSQGQWERYSLLAAFNQESAQQERFFIILERIIKEPALYIELMEFMYLCLSLGFKGSYRSSEFSHHQFEQICTALYKRIRAHHGNLSRHLSPFPMRPGRAQTNTRPHKKPAIALTLVTTASIILAVFIGLGFLLDTISNEAWQELSHIGKSLLYDETHDT